MTISEKVAYLKGLADGLELEKETSKEGKLLAVVIEVLEEIGYSIEDMEEANEMLVEGLGAVSEDLEDVEEILFSSDDDECDCDCDCAYNGDEDFFEVACPNCGEDLAIDSDILEDGQVQCPNCETVFSIDVEEEDEDED